MPNSPELLLDYVNLEGSRWYENRFDGFLRFVEVSDTYVDVESGVAMQIPADSHTEVWELTSRNYRLEIEIIHGSACLVVQAKGSRTWETTFLDSTEPKGRVGLVERCAKYCLVTYKEEAVVLGRTPRQYKRNYERSLTGNKGHEYFNWIFICIDADKRGAGHKATVAEDNAFIAKSIYGQVIKPESASDKI